MRMENFCSDCDLANKIKREADKLILLIEALSEKQYNKRCIEFTSGPVSARDLIAYQIGWGKFVIHWYKQGCLGNKFVMPGDGFETWDYADIAQHFYNKHTGNSPPAQLKTFSNVASELIIICENEHKSGHLDALGVWNWCTIKSGKKWPLSKWIQVNTVAPYKRATALIKKAN